MIKGLFAIRTLDNHFIGKKYPNLNITICIFFKEKEDAREYIKNNNILAKSIVRVTGNEEKFMQELKKLNIKIAIIKEGKMHIL